MSEALNEGQLVVPSNATEMREVENVWGFDPDLDFQKLALEAKYRARGFRLVEKADLENVPHVIVGVTYRPGYVVNGKQGDYVSVEAVVADKETLNSNPIKHLLPETVRVYGNEPVVYNDGSTGIRRSLTELFQAIGLIDVGKAVKDENPFDRPYSDWKEGADQAITGFTADKDGEKFRFVVARGLRRSDYEWQGQPATTYYLG